MRKIVSFLSTILLITVTLFSMPQTVFADNTTPNLNSAGYTSKVNPFVKSGFGGQCTSFAWGRTYEKLGIKLPAKKYKGKGTDGLTKGDSYDSFRNNAYTWWYINKALSIYPYGSAPKANSIAVWSGEGTGHVAFVESVSGSYVYFNEANFSNYKNTDYGGGWDKKLHKSSKNDMKKRDNFKLLGYIYLDSSSSSSSSTDNTVHKTTETLVYNGIYTLKNASSGKMLNVYAGVNSDGTKLTTWDRDGTTDQKFYVKHNGGGKYRLYAVTSKSGSSYERAVDINIGSDGALGTSDDYGDIWSCSSWDDCQQFYLVPQSDGSIVLELASMSGMVLASKNATEANKNGGAITLSSYNGANTQKWFFCSEDGTEVLNPTARYSFSYDGNGAESGNGEAFTIYPGESLTVIANPFTRNGYSFAGWNVNRKSDNTWYVAGKGWKTETEIAENGYTRKTYTPGLSCIIDATWTNGSNSTESFAFNAVWSQNVNRLVFDEVGFETISVNTGDSVTIPDSIPEKEGHSFLGWATYEAAEEASLLPGDSFTLDGDLTLYPVWYDDTIVNIYLKTKPSKQIYAVGDTVDTSQVSLYVEKNDGTVETVTSGFKCDKTRITALGKTTVNVSYKMRSVAFTVTAVSCPGYTSAKATAKKLTYLLPSTSSKTTMGLSVDEVYKDDVCKIICKDGDFYLIEYPYVNWNVFSYVSTAAFSNVSGVPDASEVYSNISAVTNKSTSVYHRPSTDKMISSNGNGDLTLIDTMSKGRTVTVLFEYDGYYYIRTSSYTGFVAKSALTFEDDAESVMLETAGKSEFDLGESFSLGATVLSAKYTNGKTESVSSGFKLSAPEIDGEGNYNVFVGIDDVYTYYSIRVAEKEIERIAINTYSSAKHYINEPINLQGMTIKAIYTDGTEKIIDYGFEVIGSITRIGKNTISCKYKNRTTSLELEGCERTHIDFSTASGKINSEISVSVSLVPSETVYDGSILIHYDAKKLRLNGITPNTNIPDGTMIEYNSEYGTGLAKISFVTDSGADATVLLASLKFTVLKGAYGSAETSVNAKTAFYDKDGDPLDYVIKSSEVEIINEIGDANCDGYVDIRDMVHIKKATSGLEYKESCDFNNDKLNNTLDITLLKKFILGLLKSFAN